MPSHCAAARAATNANNPSTNIARCMSDLHHDPPAHSRNGRSASQPCVTRTHPHGAERHTLVVAQTGAKARIERAAQPEVAPEPERELHVVHHAAAGDYVHRRLYVGHDADRRPLRIHAPAEREPY